MNSMGILTALSTYRWLLLNNKVTIVAIEMSSNMLFLLQNKTRHLSLRHRALTMVGCSWGWSVCLSFPPLIGWGQYLPEGNGMR